MLVVIEGCDAAGKAVQSRILSNDLSTVHISFPRYSGPVGDAIGKHLRGELEVVDRINGGKKSEYDALYLQALLSLDRYIEAADIKRILGDCKHIVCDRYWQSSFCYGAADGLDEKMLMDAHKSLPQADINILLDVSVAEAKRRRPKARDRYEENAEKMEIVRANYLRLWATMKNFEPRNEWHIINGEDTVTSVHKLILDIVESWRHKNGLSVHFG